LLRSRPRWTPPTWPVITVSAA